MKVRTLWLALFLASCAANGMAQPASPPSGDLKAAIAAGQRGDYDEAIRLLDHGLGAPGLSSEEQAKLLLYRGFAYDEAGKYDRAIEDYTKVLHLKPDALQVYYRRGIAHREKGEYAAALADFDTALAPGAKPAPGARTPPDWPFVHGDRGVVRFATGRFAEAAQDFARVVALDPSDQYGILWLHVALSREGKPNAQQFARQAAAAPADEWPQPLLSLFLGKATPDRVRQAAAAGEAEARQNQECEANFFLGEYALVHGDAKTATPLLKQVVDACTPSLGVHAGAAGELARIGK